MYQKVLTEKKIKERKNKYRETLDSTSRSESKMMIL